jgi:ubiquinone/menaquinone biosynthesis C-methylase UbiE
VIREQFANPKGVVGWLVGHFLAFKNRERGRWIVGLLDVQPSDRVLEIGFGPGADLARVAARASAVAGIDRSATMVSQARSRVRGDLREGDAGSLPWDDASFDKVFASNSVQFWDDRAKVLAEIIRVLEPGGLVLISIQPRNPGATDETSREWGERLETELAAAGLQRIRIETKRLAPVAVVAAIGRRA